MRLPRFGRRKDAADADRAVAAAHEAPPAPIDFTRRRECIVRPFDDAPGPCPGCGEPLYQSSQSYVITTRCGRAIADSFILGGTFGWFCARCPTVVINAAHVDQMLSHTLPHWDVGSQWTPLGIVALDATPDEKRDMPLGGDDNPIPLIDFTFGTRHTASQVAAVPPRIPGAGSSKRRKRKKRRG